MWHFSALWAQRGNEAGRHGRRTAHARDSERGLQRGRRRFTFTSRSRSRSRCRCIRRIPRRSGRRRKSAPARRPGPTAAIPAANPARSRSARPPRAILSPASLERFRGCRTDTHYGAYVFLANAAPRERRLENVRPHPPADIRVARVQWRY